MAEVRSVLTDEEIFREFYPHIKYLVARAHIRPEYVEDHAMMIVEKIIKKGLARQYDPSHESGANLKTFLSNFVNSYLQYYASRDRINAWRSSLSTDRTVGTDSEAGMPFLDAIGVYVEDDKSYLEAEDLVNRVRAELKNVTPETMPLFFEFVLIQAEDYGKIDAEELADVFEVTRSSVYNWLKKLRGVFEKCL